MRPFQIEKDEIERLDGLSFIRLMKKILRAEISKLKLSQSKLVLSLAINDPDGGLDAYLGCEVPERHSWLPAGRSGWQFKAVSKFSPSDAENEVLKSDHSGLKPRIEKLLNRGETYVLVIGGKDLANVDDIENRIQQVFQSYGFSTSRFKIYSSGQIADWASSIQSVVAYLKPDRTSFKDIEGWQERVLVIRRPENFVVDRQRATILESVRKTIISNFNDERATIIRLVGLQGVGKTRLIYEALKPDELKDLVLYTESPDKLPLSRFNEIAEDEEATAIFVIDECPHDRYVELAKEVEGIGGRMTLVTLDYDIDRPRDPKDIHIILNPLDRTATNTLIQQLAPGLPESARNKIAGFSNGYPRITVLLSENLLAHPDILSPEVLSSLGIVDLYERMIAGRHEDTAVILNVKNVLTMLSLFKRLGWDDEVSLQGKTVCELGKIDWSSARRIVSEQQLRGIVTSRGRYRYITPLPFAIYLASAWWERTDEASWMEFFQKLPDLETRKAFLDRLADLPFLRHAKKALEKIFSDFNNDLLNSKNGSEVFLALATADHLTAMNTLKRILGGLPRDKLLDFKDGRRNAVWALEKIAWWPDTFHEAARLLLRLADAENETWSNNATGVFTQLFQTFLGGTAVPAWERHLILEEALDSESQSIRELALRGLEAAFNLSHAFRNSVGEDQRVVIPPREWNPRSREELSKAILSALKVLDKALQNSKLEIQKDSAIVFLRSVRILLQYGLRDEIMSRLHKILAQFPDLDKEIIRTVENVIYYDSERLDEDTIKAVKSFRAQVIDEDFTGLMKRYVKSRLIEDELRENRSKVETIVRILAQESIELPEKLESELQWLVTSEAENGFLFGRMLGELDKEYYWLDKILEVTRNSEQPSAIFLGGYLSSLKLRDEQFWFRTLLKCHRDNTLRKLMVEIIWRCGGNDKTAGLLMSMLKSQEVLPEEMGLFTYGAWFLNVSLKPFTDFLEEFFKIGNGMYSPILFGIINQYAEAHPLFLENAKGILLRYLCRLQAFEGTDTMTIFYWKQLFYKLVQRFDDAAKPLLDFILEALGEDNINGELETSLREIFRCFLERDVKGTWEKIKLLLLEGGSRAWRLMYLIKGSYFLGESSLLGMIPQPLIDKWLEANPEKAPHALARLIPIHEFEPSLHPLARKLLMEYQKDENIGTILSSNWFTEGWSGSAVNHFESKLRIAEEWANDPDNSVSKWASEQVQYIKSKIKNSQRVEEERL